MVPVNGAVLPAYVVADESGSMGAYEAELNNGVASLCERLHSEPMIAAKVRLAVIGFAQDVQVRLPLSDARTLTAAPQMRIRGVTNYGAAFTMLGQQIPTDVRELKAQGYQVHRPAVFFLSDGLPSDEPAWRNARQQLIDRQVTPTAPNIIACGIGQAEAQIISQVATRPEFGFIAVPNCDIGLAISEFFHSLVQSLVQSSQTLDTQSPRLVVNRPDQFVLAVDEV
ncbi:MAG TPA: VWA domain-containing protein [Trebonia sp.]|nr:VWA domain-containing protein [Trebonia sp.]